MSFLSVGRLFQIDEALNISLWLEQGINEMVLEAYSSVSEV